MTVLFVVLLTTMALALAVIVTVARASRDRVAPGGASPGRLPNAAAAWLRNPRRGGDVGSRR